MNSSSPKTIVGGGLVGSLLSVYLSNAGHSVEMFERRVDLRRHKISAGRSINLALAERGIRPLIELGLWNRVQPLLIPMKGRMIHDLQGNLRFQAYSGKENEFIYSVSRQLLTAELLTAAEETGQLKVHFESPVEEIDFSGKRLVVNSRGYSVSEVFGTDGSASVLRNAIVKATGAKVSEEKLVHGYKELTMPPKNSQHAMEKNALHIWPRGTHMLIALPNLDGSFTVTLFLPFQNAEHSFEKLTTPKAVTEFFESQFPDALEKIPNLVEEFQINPTGQMTTVRLDRWSHENLLLLGDAAHAIVPFHGQGMNCGFEDCRVLNSLMKKQTAWNELSAEFERLRKSNSNAIADLAIENYIEMRDSVRDPKFHLKKKIEWLLEEKFPEKFVARYSLVMFHHLPYSEVKERGELNKKILERLSENLDQIEALDMKLAAELLQPIPDLPREL